MSCFLRLSAAQGGPDLGDEAMLSIIRNMFAIALLEILSGCVFFCGPDRWADRLELEAKCGMSPQEIERLADRQLVKAEIPTARRTHVIRDGATDVLLIFKEDQLQSIQSAWTYAYGKVLYSQRVKLCPPDAGPEL